MKVTRKMLREFYSRHFSIHPLLKVIGLRGFANREFGFEIIEEGGEERFVRNISFKTPADLVAYLADVGPKSAYVGAMFEPPPSPGVSITKLRWLGRELVFDLDLTDYDDVRTCGKGKEHVCPKCWRIAQDAITFVVETLEEDFGFEKIVVVFSGRRGFHVWVLDEVARTFDEETREVIVNYISPENPQSAVLPLRWKQRALKIIGRRFIAPQMKQLIPYLPRLDKRVTIDLNRLLRMPGSVHGATGRLCTIVKDPQEFYPDDAPSILEILGYD